MFKAYNFFSPSFVSFNTPIYFVQFLNSPYTTKRAKMQKCPKCEFTAGFKTAVDKHSQWFHAELIHAETSKSSEEKEDHIRSVETQYVINEGEVSCPTERPNITFVDIKPNNNEGHVNRNADCIENNSSTPETFECIAAKIKEAKEAWEQKDERKFDSQLIQHHLSSRFFFIMISFS